MLARQLLPLDGFDPSAAGTGTGNREAQAKYPGVFAFGEPRGLIRPDVTSDSGAPTSKDNPVNGNLKVDVDGEMFTAYVSFKVQGRRRRGIRKEHEIRAVCRRGTYRKRQPENRRCGAEGQMDFQGELD